jgi:uncharacterized protein YchJ
MPITDLVGQLASTGALDAWASLPQERLAHVIDEALFATEDCWKSHDGIVLLLPSALDGSIFSHRVTADELARGQLPLAPDFVLLDDGVDALMLASGDTIELTDNLGDGPDGPPLRSLVGPRGWLDGFAAGDHVALKRSSGVFEVISVSASDLDVGYDGIRAIERALDSVGPPGAQTEVRELLLEALAHDPAAFDTPLMPVGGLLARAGLSVDGSYARPAGGEWLPPDADRRRQTLAMRFRFEPCCDEAFGAVLAGWDDFLLDRTTAIEQPAPAETVRALGHGLVPYAFVELVLGHEVGGSPQLEAFATSLIDAGSNESAPALFVRAMNAELDGRVHDAEVDFEAAVTLDSGFRQAATELARFAADRGDIGRAVALAGGAGAKPGASELAYLFDALPSYAGIGRNDPCPCGSGRKFKMCCHDHPTVPADRRVGWLLQRIAAFVGRPPWKHHLRGLAAAAVRGSHPLQDVDERRMGNEVVPFVDDPFLVDVATFESGAIRDYLARRSMLLPSEDRDLLEGWLDTDRCLFEVIDVRAGSSLTLRDARSGARIEVAEAVASRELQRGHFLFARVAPVGPTLNLVGQSLVIDPVRRPSLTGLLDGDVDSATLAYWYGTLQAPPVVLSPDGERVPAIRAIVRHSLGSEDLVELGDHFEPGGGPNEWLDIEEVDAGRVVRAYLQGAGEGFIEIIANRAEELDRVLDRLRSLDPALEVAFDERRPVGDGGA